MLKLFKLKPLQDGDGREFEAIRPLRNGEAVEYVSACRRLHEFHRSQDLIHLIVANEKEFHATIDNIVLQARTERRSALSQDTSEARVLQRLMVNYLTATRLYLDHRQTVLTRRHGSNSEILAAFNEARRRIHDANPEYRFVYELRNYVQHCGMPLQVARVSQVLRQAADTEYLEASVLIGFNRDKLLSDYSEWQYARDFIASQPVEFEALPIITRCTPLFQEIERTVINSLMPRLWTDARYILFILQEATDSQGAGQVADITDVPGPETAFNLAPVTPPYDLLRWLGLVTLQAGPPGLAIDLDRLASGAPPTVAT